MHSRSSATNIYAGASQRSRRLREWLSVVRRRTARGARLLFRVAGRICLLVDTTFAIVWIFARAEQRVDERRRNRSDRRLRRQLQPRELSVANQDNQRHIACLLQLVRLRLPRTPRSKPRSIRTAAIVVINLSAQPHSRLYTNRVSKGRCLRLCTFAREIFSSLTRSLLASRTMRKTLSISDTRKREYTGSCSALSVASAPGQSAPNSLKSPSFEQTSTCVVSISIPRRIARRLKSTGSEAYIEY